MKIFVFDFQIASKSVLAVFVVSTYQNGSPPESANWFFKYLLDSGDDCRVPKQLLSGLQYTIFGLGNSLYEGNFNLVCISGTFLHSNTGVNLSVFPSINCCGNSFHAKCLCFVNSDIQRITYHPAE